jgi:hypothetical protein
MRSVNFLQFRLTTDDTLPLTRRMEQSVSVQGSIQGWMVPTFPRAAVPAWRRAEKE